MAPKKVKKEGAYLLQEEKADRNFSKAYLATYSDKSGLNIFSNLGSFGKIDPSFALLLKQKKERECPNMNRISIIKLIEMLQTSNNFYFAVELAEHGNVRKYQNGNGLSKLGDDLKALYEILTGQLPSKAYKSEYEIQAALSTDTDLRKLQYSEMCKGFLRGLLQIDQQRRFSYNQFYNHPWLRQNQLIENQAESYYRNFNYASYSRIISLF